MKKYFLLLIIITLICYTNSYSQTKKDNANPDIIYYGNEYYRIAGIGFSDSLRENSFDRIPLYYKNKVRNKVWKLGKHSAGISVAFETNSSLISVKWDLLNNNSMPHMAETGIKGVDLYCKVNNKWQYIATGKPDSSSNEKIIIKNMNTEWKQFRVYLPLYDCTTSLKIGVTEKSVIRKSKKHEKKPIVFYGTSITQGGCASRPGMAYTNIISRKLGVECINYGFSGNGTLEREVGEILSQIDAAFYVIDCLPNVTSDLVKKRTIELVDEIRKNKLNTPIVLVESQYRDGDFLVDEKIKIAKEKNKSLLMQFNRMLKDGYKNIYYIPHGNMIGTDHEATVDGTHFTDLGFLRYSEKLVKIFNKMGLTKN